LVFYFSGDLEYKARHSGVNPNVKQTWMSGHSLLSGVDQPNYFNTHQIIKTRVLNNKSLIDDNRHFRCNSGAEPVILYGNNGRCGHEVY
jgi:hypothetical protein